MTGVSVLGVVCIVITQYEKFTEARYRVFRAGGCFHTWNYCSVVGDRSEPLNNDRALCYSGTLRHSYCTKCRFPSAMLERYVQRTVVGCVFVASRVTS